MHSLTRFERVDVPPLAIEKITSLYERGLYVQAHAVANEFGDLRGWSGTSARVIGGRLAGNLGSRKIGNWLMLRAWRGSRTDSEAAYFCGCAIMERRGPLAALKFLQSLPNPAIQGDSRGDLLGLKAQAFAAFRDFARAEQTLAEAENAGGNVAWLLCERSSLYELEDKYHESLEVAQHALSVRPWFRPAVQRAAHLMQLLGRDADGAALLSEALTHIESGACAKQLSATLEEMGDYSGAIEAWKRVSELDLLASEESRQGWHGRMADLLYYSNSPTEAAHHARLAGDKDFYDQFATRLESPERLELKRVHLPVGFVRQHHITCAPATLSALAGYLGTPVDHASIAREITYDGTPDYLERSWAGKNGFEAREFRVTWKSATALIDRGIPFTLTTTEIASGHLQAVIGYDALRKTLIIRDPYQRYHSEFFADPLLKRYAGFGPRGMVMIPKEQADRLDGIELPDVEFFDAYYQLRCAIDSHDRTAADGALTSLESLDRDHRLTHFARRDLAFYDGNVHHQLSTAEDLLRLYPDQGSFLLGKSRALSELANREEYEVFLRDLAGKDFEPLFWREWATYLASDARRRNDAHRLVLRALRHRPVDSDNLATRANLLWDDRRFAESTELYRLAACLRDTVDSYSRSYFLASRHLREADSAIQWLRERCSRHGLRSSQPARILFWALQILDRSQEAFEVLDQAIAQRPTDGDLLLHASDSYARQGQFERADELLKAAKGCSARTAWLRTAAGIADYRCDLPASLKLWRQILEAEPLALDAQRTTIRLIAEVECRPAAMRRIAELADRFPHHVPLHRLWVEWARYDGTGEWERIARHSLSLDPGDAWLHRELALALSEKREFESSIAEARTALMIEPESAASHSVLGTALLRAEHFEEARTSFKSALALSIDAGSAIYDLIATSRSIEEKREAAAFVRSELIKQVVFGEGLLTFREAFYSILEPDEMLAALQEAHAARADLWHAWASLIRQLVDMRLFDDALKRATECAERFPLIPGAWSELALVHRLKGDREGEIRALKRALIINPGWTSAARELSTAHEARAEFDEARRVIESAIAAAPLEAANHGMLADLLWRSGEPELAVERVILAVRHSPGYDWGWEALREWTEKIGASERASEVARSLTITRPGEARSWYLLAQILPETGAEEALHALDRAIELSPRFTDAHDLRAFTLSQEGRFDEAVKACHPPAYGENVPAALLGREAWLEAARGHIPLAIEKTRAVVQKHPDYYWGWSQISEWSFQLGRHQESLDSAKVLMRLAPRAPAPLGMMARAQHALGKTGDALGSLSRAFDLDPTYEFAGYTLFQHHLDIRDLEAAERLLKRLLIHLPGARSESAKVRLAAMRGDRDTALGGLRSLMFTEGEIAGPLHAAVVACARLDWEKSVDRLIFEALDNPNANPEVGALWVNRFTSAGNWGKRRRLFKLDPRSELGRRARHAFVGAIGERQQPRYLMKLLARERETLRKSTGMWGQVGYALAATGQWRETVAWMNDWQDRRDLEPWMLGNLALALRHECRSADARLVSEHALTLHGDHTTGDHHIWMALDHAAKGIVEGAREHLDRTQKPNDSAMNEAAYALAAAWIAVNDAPVESRLRVFNDQTHVLREARLRNAFKSPVLKESGRQVIDRMAAVAGTKPFRLIRFRDQYFSGNESKLPFSITWLVVVLCIVGVNIARLADSGRSDQEPIVFSTPKPRFTPAERVPLSEDRSVMNLGPNRQAPQPILPPVDLERIPTPKPTPKVDRK